MQSLRSVVTSLKSRVGSLSAAVSRRYKAHQIDWANFLNIFTVAVFTTGLIALAALIWLYVRPIQTAEIKVPVATDQSSYYPGEEIGGIFFGEIKYKGDVKVLRQVYCKNYQAVIAPPEYAKNGDFYDTQSVPRVLEGLSVTIGNLPSDVPVGANCVLQFTNVYEIQTPFGLRKETYQYYTQNFAIVTKERRMQLECEATGRKDCNFIIDIPKDNNTAPQDTPAVQSSPETEPVPTTQPTIINNDNRRTVNNPPAEQEPAPRFEERCTVDFIIKFGCRQVPANN